MLVYKKYIDKLSYFDKCYRLFWSLFHSIIGFLPARIGSVFMVPLLRLFGAQIGTNVRIYGNCKIYSPRNLVIGSGSSIGPKADIYNVAKVKIGCGTVISQNVWLCCASHNFKSTTFELVTKELVIGANCWIAARSSLILVESMGDNVVIGGGTNVRQRHIESNTLVLGATNSFSKWR